MGLLDNQTTADYYYGDEFGGYQFVSLDDIVTNFTIAYVGENKIIPKIKRTDIAFHAQRAIQELSFDTFKSIKSQEFDVPPSLVFPLPQDYVNYTKICWTDTAGIEHPLYPTRHTSNPTAFIQNEDGDYKINPIATLTQGNHVIVLDGDYSDILVHGMRVNGPNLKKQNWIHKITTTNGITSITLKNYDGTKLKPALATTNEEIRITRFRYLGNDIKIDNNSLTQTTLTADGAAGDTQLNVASTDGLKVGMFVNLEAFVNDDNVGDGDEAIKIVGIGNTTVELSHPASFAFTSGETVGFISNEEVSTSWNNFKNHDQVTNSLVDEYDYDDDIYELNVGGRYGLDPAHAQVNGSYYIDNLRGLIHFSSNVSGKNVIIKYISDGLGKDSEMIVHKFAEEAMYKSIAYAILSTSTFGQGLVPRFKKEKFAAIRTAKLRLSNLKPEELAQTFRGKAKIIKH